MSESVTTIEQTIQQIRLSLRDYIEATYHISNEQIVKQRQSLLDESGAISQVPYLESTPRYVLGPKFSSLGLPPAASELLRMMAAPTNSGGLGLLHDPPYLHQAEALTKAVVERRSLVVTTGTGSGKTESFLLPILSKLADEARERRESFQISAVRALVLYPMNALVNDQLGRLRLMFGDPGVSDQFTKWADRPVRFARYTSRTLYPGVRTSSKDSVRLRPIQKFYVDLMERADGDGVRAESARSLILELQSLGKWPSKPDLQKWFGRPGSRWQRNGEYVRGVTLPHDAELFTRHEVLARPPDVLVTNYSMVEYMLMRPLERPIFNATRKWLETHPEESFVLVIDEAHLYRGAAGAEVGLLIRRLRDRLGIDPNRLQVICTSASFNNPVRAGEFAADLSGKQSIDFDTIQGIYDFRPADGRGTVEEAEVFASVRTEDLYSTNEELRRQAVRRVLNLRGVDSGTNLEEDLFAALKDFPPLGRLVNRTMREARALQELAADCFEANEMVGNQALTALVALASMAKAQSADAGLLPCRVHAFFRGLPGLWACLDPECSEITDVGTIGRLYGQPREVCVCGARVFEFYTCRHCGSAYSRAYTDNVADPTFLWSEQGMTFESSEGEVHELQALDLCLEEPLADTAEPVDLDLVTGRINPLRLGARTRRVFLPRERKAQLANDSDDDDDDDGSSTTVKRVRPAGEFYPCAICQKHASYGKSSVQDHQTKGDEPFQALVTRQLEVQSPGIQPATEFAPLRGRKVLVFSDSRQVAARLAPNLQTYAMRDVIRPLMLRGLSRLHGTPGIGNRVGLEDLYFAVMLAAREFNIRLRPELRTGESMQLQRDLDLAHGRGDLGDPEALFELLIEARSENSPNSLLRAMVGTLTNRWTGLESLGLATLSERDRDRDRLLGELPNLPPFETNEQKLALVRLWINCWTGPGIWFPTMPTAWWMNEVRGHKGEFKRLGDWFGDRQVSRSFKKDWLPVLLSNFCEPQGNTHRMRAVRLVLNSDGDWAYCDTCRTTQRPFPDLNKCIACRRSTVRLIDPDVDPVFTARKGYFRQSVKRALNEPPEAPTVLVAAEHTAQLGDAQGDDIFSKSEEHELLFQDIDIGAVIESQNSSAIDVLSCTTTMEVGIDIGALSGVALRNMPPSRANYQQRAGRAGRRGNSIATVIAFGSADSHDEQYFREPREMIRGQVDDPILSLDNIDIARRHVTAYLLQQYYSERLPNILPEGQPQLFEVLGKVAQFISNDSDLNRDDFLKWLNLNIASLRLQVSAWLPVQLSEDSKTLILRDLATHTISEIDRAIDWDLIDRADSEGDVVVSESDHEFVDESGSPDEDIEVQAEPGEEKSNQVGVRENLLDRLLYKGVLPRYAFPTDVVTFHVFDYENSTSYRPTYQYSPSQGLPVALSQYAPGKEVWIDGKLWTSGALYSPIRSELYEAWTDSRLYFECSVCGFARTVGKHQAEKGDRLDCPACGAHDAFGAARTWIRPPGFAHPCSLEEGTSPDDQPARSFATRAKLVAPGPDQDLGWTVLTPRIRQFFNRDFLLVTNSGPNQEGYTYCLLCGLIEPTAISTGSIHSSHAKPFPDHRQPDCPGGRSTRGLVLGTDFVSDVLLIDLRVDEPLSLRPSLLATKVALRTIAEAITIAATTKLEIEPGELQAEFRPALSDLGKQGLEAQIYLYDTLSGGAGFAREVGTRAIQILDDALYLLEGCPANCDKSCYRCLRSFRNRFEHSQLDRFVGASLLKYLLKGVDPVMDATRLAASTGRLHEDLLRHGIEDIELSRNAVVLVPGIGEVLAPILAQYQHQKFIIAVHEALTPDYSSDVMIRDVMENSASVRVELVDDILISQNLPVASRRVIKHVTGR